MLVLFNWREWKIIVQLYTLSRKILYYSTRITFRNCVIVNFELSNSIVLCLKSYEMHSMQQKCQFILTCDLSYHIRIWFTQNCGIIINWRHFQRLKINYSCRYIIVFNLYNTELLSIGITIIYVTIKLALTKRQRRQKTFRIHVVTKIKLFNKIWFCNSL